MLTINKLSKEKSRLKTKLIVGIDPGITCGIAILSIDAKPILIESIKGISKHELIKKISKHGKAILIASDVVPVPDFVKKIASTLNSTLFSPEKSLESYEKQTIVDKYLKYHKIEIKDHHSRDALAAAIKAYQHYKSKFDQIEALIKKNKLKIPSDEIKLLLIKGKSIKKAIKAFEMEIEKSKGEAFQKISSKKLFSLKKKRGQERSILLEKIEELKVQNEELKKQIKALKEKIKELNEELNKEREKYKEELWKDKVYQIQRIEIETLRNRLSKALEECEKYKEELNLRKKLQEKSKEEFIKLKPIESFTKDGIEKASKLYGINPGDIVLLLNGSCGGASTAKVLASKGIKAVITCTNMAHQAIDKLLEYGISIIPSNKLKIEWIDGFPFVAVSDFNKALKELKSL